MSSFAFVAAAPLTKATGGWELANKHNSFTGGKALQSYAPRATRAQVRMISPELARSAIAVYGVVIAGGGIGAFLKSGSKPSIISGVTAGIVLGGAYFKDSVPVALGTAVVLTIVFGIRLLKTKKFVPAGALCIASLLAAVFFAASIYA